MLENPEGGRRITELPEKYRGATENGNRAPEKSQPKSGFGPEAGSEAQTRLEVTETKIGHLIEAVTEGLNSPYAAQSLKDLEAQAATDKATIERLRALPSLATVLPHPAMLVQRALDLQEMFRHDPVAGREALRPLSGPVGGTATRSGGSLRCRGHAISAAPSRSRKQRKSSWYRRWLRGRDSISEPVVSCAALVP